jgi:vancomycin permeability regulator SanA
MIAALVCVAVVLGIYPADRTVWCVEMVWAVVMGCVRTLPNVYFSRRIDAAAVLYKAGTNQPNQNCPLTALSKL